MKYSNLMDTIPDWYVHDESVLEEYTKLGGAGIPSPEERDLQ